MGQQLPLTISYKNDAFWFPQVAPQLNATFTDTTLTFDNEIGKGQFYKVGIDTGLAVRKLEMLFHQDVVFTRESTEHPGYYVLLSNLSEQTLETNTGEQLYKLGYGSDNGIYFSSPFLSASYTFKPGIRYHLIFIIITYDRIRNFIERQPDAQQPLLHSIVDKDKPIYHVEFLDEHFMNLLKAIDSNLNDDRPNNLLIHSKTLELCYYLLQRVEQRSSNMSTRNIHEDDVNKLKEVRRALLDNYQDECPPIAEAARSIAMSPTKFKSLFKQMFGQTYYQFYKNVRMYKAKELLEQKNMSVSEVGYMLGYNNLSKFTQAYKKAFGMAPSAAARL